MLCVYIISLAIWAFTRLFFRFCKIVCTKSASSENLCCSSILRRILDVLIFGGRVFFKVISFNLDL